MSVSSTMISHSMTERSATVMITVGLKLWAPMTTSPSSLGRLVTTPSMGEITVVLSRSSLRAVELGLELGDAPALGLDRGLAHPEVGLGLVELLVGDELVLVHPLRALEGQPRLLDVGQRPVQLGPGRLDRRLPPGGSPPRSARPRCAPAPGRA